MLNTIAYDQMVKAAESAGMPGKYTDDLYVHDKNTLFSEAAPQIFGWILRDRGTHIINAEMLDSHGRTPGSYVEFIDKTFGDPVKKYFLYTPRTGLREMPDAKALAVELDRYYHDWLNRTTEAERSYGQIY